MSKPVIDGRTCLCCESWPICKIRTMLEKLADEMASVYRFHDITDFPPLVHQLYEFAGRSCRVWNEEPMGNPKPGQLDCREDK